MSPFRMSQFLVDKAESSSANSARSTKMKLHRTCALSLSVVDIQRQRVVVCGRLCVAGVCG
eukprot:m.193061 g.193061  ORF g.193061 m.193061 type:complete len:61 (-) comp18616_c0_seq1:303-485(-)